MHPMHPNCSRKLRKGWYKNGPRAVTTHPLGRMPYSYSPLVLHASVILLVLVGSGLALPGHRIMGTTHHPAGSCSHQPSRLAVSPILATRRSYLPNRESADRAAWYPHIPCTPAPGGVDDEHIYRSRAEVA